MARVQSTYRSVVRHRTAPPLVEGVATATIRPMADRRAPGDGGLTAPAPWWWACPGGLLALCVALVGLSSANALFGATDYDGGVWFGAAVALAHGSLPYRDFVFVAPPGSTLLLAPLGLVSRLIGTRDAFAAARLLTVAVMAVNATLAGLVVRHRGAVATIVAGVAVALAPEALAADYSVLLEPYLMAALLVATLCCFPAGKVAATRAVALAGVAFGVAGAIKPWAVVPLLVAVVVVALERRLKALALLAGAAVGFVVPCGVFFVGVPAAFVRDVVTSQLARAAPGAVVPLAGRLGVLLGIGEVRGPERSLVAILICVFAIEVAACVVVWATVRGRSSPLEWFALVATVATITTLLLPQVFYRHYAYFVEPFAAIVAALVVAHALEAVEAHWPVVSARTLGRAALATIVLLAVAPLALDLHRATLAAGRAVDPGPAVAAVVPPGSCVVTDMSSIALSAGRFSSGGRCPMVVDAFGEWLAAAPGDPPGRHRYLPRPLARRWRGWFAAADAVVLGGRHSFRIPWTPALTSWFAAHFVEAPTSADERCDRLPSPPLTATPPCARRGGAAEEAPSAPLERGERQDEALLPLAGEVDRRPGVLPLALDLEHDAPAEALVHDGVAPHEPEELRTAGGRHALERRVARAAPRAGGARRDVDGPRPAAAGARGEPAAEHDPVPDVLVELVGDLLEEPARDRVADLPEAASSSRCG